MSRTSLQLQPSDYYVAEHDGRVMVRRLWETVDGYVLVWCNRGVEGHKDPADMCSGRVPCRWVEPPPPPAMTSSGVVRGTFLSVVAPEDGVGRQLVVRAPDGLLEVKTVMVYDRLELV